MTLTERIPTQELKHGLNTMHRAGQTRRVQCTSFLYLGYQTIKQLLLPNRNPRFRHKYNSNSLLRQRPNHNHSLARAHRMNRRPSKHTLVSKANLHKLRRWLAIVRLSPNLNPCRMGAQHPFLRITMPECQEQSTQPPQDLLSSSSQVHPRL